jgi:uncharacterized damage-inducible protein DinB
VDGEWSFIQTLRHLVLVTDGWIRRAALGDPSPWHPLGLPWDDPDETRAVPAGITRDREARPSLDEVLELRRDRMATVRELVDGLTDESLDRDTEPVEAPGWPESRSYRVRNLLLHVFHEEWEHWSYAERDLDALTARGGERRLAGGQARQKTVRAERVIVRTGSPKPRRLRFLRDCAVGTQGWRSGMGADQVPDAEGHRDRQAAQQELTQTRPVVETGPMTERTG